MKIYKIESFYSSEYGENDCIDVYIEAKNQKDAEEIYENFFPEDDGYCGGYQIDSIEEVYINRVDLVKNEGKTFFTATTPCIKEL